MRMLTLVPLFLLTASCARPIAVGSPPPVAVRPGISVLLSDSLGLIQGRRIGLVTNHTGIDEHGISDIELLRGPVAISAGAHLVRLFSPEHGIRGTEDREHIASGIDAQSGLPVFSLYDAATAAPPDSLLRDLDAIVVDLQDVGTRTWTYVGAMLYTLQSAARLHLRVIVLDRPNPISGTHTDGPFLDSTLANPWPPQPGKPGKAFALYPMPLRHGMTMAELARFYDDVLGLHAELKVVPVAGWHRSMWFDETGLPWVKPSPNLPNLTSVLLYPALVAFEGSNVSVGRGTSDPFQRFGAPWMHPGDVVARLRAMRIPGVVFDVDTFTPRAPGDGKFDGKAIPGVHMAIYDRDAMDPALISVAILSVLHATSPDSLRISVRTFDERLGSPAVREAILRGDAPLAVMGPEVVAASRFVDRVRRYFIYP